ncbi:MAG TPA: 16S rRNA (cytidine(1402)-2'-O)-methyltransferase [Burkholderiales bacterium]|nr:16S rRNA (cytidine(1402)-2'-O)-methyltransferase [Burkholderiales bacterium]
MSGHEDPGSQQSGQLYVVATPIGNLDDLSVRARKVLSQVERIYAEDTRTSSVLLAQYGLQTTLKSFHAHNEAKAAPEIIAYLRAGHSVALISDAGTPGVSDPGALLVTQAHAAGIRVVPIPGANAAITALCATGFAGAFTFIGFLPNKSTARRKTLELSRDGAAHLIFYEAPHRILECIEDIAAVMGADRELVIARELSKMFEQIHRCKAGEALAWLQQDANRQRGEFVVVVQGANAQEETAFAEGARVLRLLLEELPLKQAARLAASLSGARKNQLYELGLEWAKIRDMEVPVAEENDE